VDASFVDNKGRGRVPSSADTLDNCNCKLVGGGSIDDVDCVVCVSIDVSQMRGIYIEWWTD
jgi:hypothetical protein